jgi:hypothetical protein
MIWPPHFEFVTSLSDILLHFASWMPL